MTKKTFEQIYDETHLRLYAFIYAKCPSREDAADIMQETYMEFIKAFRRHGSGQIRDPAAFLTQIAKKKLSRLYKDRNEPPFSLEEEGDDGVTLSDILTGEEETEQTVLARSQAEQLWSMIEKKDPVTSRIFTLYFRGDYKIKEIAEIIGLTEAQVKNKLYRTLKELRRFYEEEEKP